MSNPHVHAKASARRYGGALEDYLDIHAFMDSSKAVVADNRHRILTHTPWFVVEVLPRVFGELRYNSDNKPYMVRQIGFDHIEEDFRGWIPATTDWFGSLNYELWMQNARVPPPSSSKLRESNLTQKEATVD